MFPWPTVAWLVEMFQLDARFGSYNATMRRLGEQGRGDSEIHQTQGDVSAG